MDAQVPVFPYLPTLTRLALGLGIGLFVGVDRERRQKEAGVRIFAFVGLLGAIGGLIGSPFDLLVLALLGVLVTLLNVETLRNGQGAELTTSAALLVTAFAGLLAGQGNTFTPTLLGVTTAALLAWKEPLKGFSRTLTEPELRSAILLAILAFVIYPVLPVGSVDPWQLVDVRAAWVTVILIAALGFGSYVLLKLYGARGIELAGFLGGLVNSTVTITELARRVRTSEGALADVAYRGSALATAAMLARNVVILGFLAPATLARAGLPFGLALGGTLVMGLGWRSGAGRSAEGARPGVSLPGVESPFSLTAALRFGVVFLALQIAATLAQRHIGEGGFYAVCLLGGLFSSASALASAANLAASGELAVAVAANGALIASLSSALVNLPVVARVGGDPVLTRRVARALLLPSLLGGVGVALVAAFVPRG